MTGITMCDDLKASTQVISFRNQFEFYRPPVFPCREDERSDKPPPPASSRGAWLPYGNCAAVSAYRRR